MKKWIIIIYIFNWNETISELSLLVCWVRKRLFVCVRSWKLQRNVHCFPVTGRLFFSSQKSRTCLRVISKTHLKCVRLQLFLFISQSNFHSRFRKRIPCPVTHLCWKGKKICWVLFSRWFLIRLETCWSFLHSQAQAAVETFQDCFWNMTFSKAHFLLNPRILSFEVKKPRETNKPNHFLHTLQILKNKCYSA